MTNVQLKNDCQRRCICTRKYAESTKSSKSSAAKSGKSGKSRKSSRSRKKTKFPLPLQMTQAQKAALKLAEREALRLSKQIAKPKLPFPTMKPQKPKLTGFQALTAAAEKERLKKEKREARIRVKQNLERFKPDVNARLRLPPGLRNKLPPGSRMLNGVIVGPDGKPIKMNPGGEPILTGKWAKKKGGKGKKGKGKSKSKFDSYGVSKENTPSAILRKKRNIKISYPTELKFKKWIPPYLLPWPRKPRVKVDLPPLSQRKWIPPYLRKKKLREKIEIAYPPLEFRKWIPPYLRKRSPKPKLISLHGKTFHIDPSTLIKYWYHFKFLDDWYGIISGNYSQTHKKYSFKTNGFQAPCNCMVAMTISKLFRMKHWHRNFLNGLLDIGNNLYVESLRYLPPETKQAIKVEEVHKSFYFGRTKITMTLNDDAYTGKVFKDYEDEKYLRKVLKDFFKTNYSGILILNKRYRAVWKQDGKYFMFDPLEHDEHGHDWTGIPSYGFCYVTMFLSTEKMVDFVHESIADTTRNYKFTLIPCDILRTTEVVTDYPDCLLEFEPEQKKPISKKDLDKMLPPPPPPPVEEVEEDEEWLELDEVAPEVIPPDKPPRKNKIKEPIEKPKAESVTYFTTIVPAKLGILRASTYQTDPKFTRFKGQQTLANAVAALTMLRLYKSRKWTNTVIDNVLRTGEVVYHDSQKNKFKGESLKFDHIVDKITIEEREFSPKFDELFVIGKLQAGAQVLDLLSALREFFSDNATAIICGPLTLAAWFEDGMFYMFDPDERDANGNVIIRTIEVGSEIVFKDIPPGRACLTWYSNLSDLVEKYTKNIDIRYRKDYFSICKVEIKDYVPPYDDWHNFKALRENKWILRGSFSQNSKRFPKETRNTQCTAMAALALGYTKITPVTEWSNETVDEVVNQGDLYYTDCVKDLKDTKRFISGMLLVDELQRSFKLEDREIFFEIDDCVVNGIIPPEQPLDGTALLEGLKEFFEMNDCGILTAKSNSVAIWRYKGYYFSFDSHSRDDEGIASNYGFSCVLRFTKLQDLAACIEANFNTESNNFFNISSIEVTVLMTGETGQSLPPLKNYVQLDNVMAILRGNMSDTAEEFGFNRGKQVAANCAVAAGMAALYPPLEWTPETLDKILKNGDQLYLESKEAIYKDMIELVKISAAPKPVEKVEPPKKGKRGGGLGYMESKSNDLFEQLYSDKVSTFGSTRQSRFSDGPRAGGLPNAMEVDPLAVDLVEDMNSDRLMHNFKIGINKVEMTMELENQGPIDSDLEPRLQKYLVDPPLDPLDKKELMLETDFVTYYIRKDNNVYYLFTSQPCDHEGCFFGREEWPQPEPPPPEPVEIEEALSEMTEEGEEEAEVEVADEEVAIDAQMFNEFPVYNDDEVMEEEIPQITFKHSEHYWKEKADKDGRCYIAWFAQPEYLIQHILLNLPEDIKKSERYSLQRIIVRATPEIKDHFNPLEADRTSPYDGDYYDFKEIEREKWILRGTYNQNYEMFPEANRGHQSIANCFTALAFFQLYSVMTFKTHTVDNILKYGDRLLTFTKNLRRKALRENKDVHLTESQIEEIMTGETFGINDIFRVFSVGSDQVTVETIPYQIVGEIYAKPPSQIMDVKDGLTKFFETEKMGILCAKDLCLAVVKGSSRMFYMFDPQSRGPSGLKCINGVACITRFIELSYLTELFLKNLAKEGSNAYAIHKIIVTTKKVLPPVVPAIPDLPAENSALVGYSLVVPGKRIIRGTFSQEDPRFGRGQNIQSSAVALVALAMSLIHRCSNWTKPLIDEIILLGDEVYAKALDKLGFNFNPWEQVMTLEYVPSDFVIGDLRANCELRDTTQRGVFDIKDPHVQHIRHGIERFFEENSHGVIESETLTVAIWEDDFEHMIYIFDPNPRGPTGMPLVINGTACAIGCKDSKMAAEHLISILGEKSNEAYVITPVEIVIGKNKKKCRKLVRNVRKTASLMDRKRKNLELRRKKEDARLALLGRSEFYKPPGTEIYTLRGTRSQNSKIYCLHSRNNQDIPICMTAFVMERMLPFRKWTSTTIDQILDIGDQLYKDCFVINSPTHRKIGLEFVLRQVIIKDVKVHVAICKPVIINRFTLDNILKGLTIYFTQKQFCLFETANQWVAVFLRDDEYYLFDSHDRNLLGEVSCPCGSAVLVKYPNLESLVKQLYANYCVEDEQIFRVVLLGIKNIEKYEPTPCRCGVNLTEAPPAKEEPKLVDC